MLIDIDTIAAPFLWCFNFFGFDETFINIVALKKFCEELGFALVRD